MLVAGNEPVPDRLMTEPVKTLGSTSSPRQWEPYYTISDDLSGEELAALRETAHLTFYGFYDVAVSRFSQHPLQGSTHPFVQSRMLKSISIWDLTTSDYKRCSFAGFLPIACSLSMEQMPGICWYCLSVLPTCRQMESCGTRWTLLCKLQPRSRRNL